MVFHSSSSWPGSAGSSSTSRGTNFGQRMFCQRQKWIAVVQVCFSMSVLPNTCLTTTRPPDPAARQSMGVPHWAQFPLPSATPQPEPCGW